MKGSLCPAMSDISSTDVVITFSVPTAVGGSEDGAARRTHEGTPRGFPPGTFWNEDGASTCPTDGASRAKGAPSGAAAATARRTTVAYVVNEASPGLLQAAESGALLSLREACEAVGAELQTLHFGKLDFGETAVLDRFYNAGECPFPGVRPLPLHGSGCSVDQATLCTLLLGSKVH